MRAPVGSYMKHLTIRLYNTHGTRDQEHAK